MKKISFQLFVMFSCVNAVAQTKEQLSMEAFLGRKEKTVMSVTVEDAAYKVVYNYQNGNYISSIPVSLNKYLSIRTSSWVPSVSVLTIPFKVRPARGTFSQNVKADIKNASVFVGPPMEQNQRTSLPLDYLLGRPPRNIHRKIQPERLQSRHSLRSRPVLGSPTPITRFHLPLFRQVLILL